MKAIFDFQKPIDIAEEDNSFEVIIDIGAFSNGANGLSAYQIALLNGFVGTEAQWLLSIVGATGPAGAIGATGAAGADGAVGADGASAYDVAVSNGFIGTEPDWLATLAGQGFDWEGTWQAATEYDLYDVVYYDGSCYVCIATPNADILPDALTHWELVVSKGDTGPTGAAGPAGDLTTTSVIALATATAEPLGASVELHKISKTGTYTDLIGQPDLTVYVPYTGATGDVDLNDKDLGNVATLGIGVVTPNNKIQVLDLIEFDDSNQNMTVGTQAGYNIATGAQYNTFIGYKAGFFDSGSTSSADYNLGVGSEVLFNNISGSNNIAIGRRSLYENTTGSANLAIGAQSLLTNVSGGQNLCIGDRSLYFNTIGNNNVAIGVESMYDNTEGSENTALGAQSLENNTTGSYNIAIGNLALSAVLSGESNIGIGNSTGTALTTGIENVLIGNSINVGNVSNNVVIADGGGTVVIHDDATDCTITNNLKAPTAEFGGAANYSDFEADGTLHFNGDATVWDDLRITPGSFDRPGTSDPAYVSYTPTGSAIATYLTEWAIDDIASFTVQLPHNYKEGTDIYVHVHWTPGLRGAAEGAGVLVGWKVDYVWANIDGTFGAMGTANLSDACDGTDDKHQMTPSVTIDGHTSSKDISSMLICNIKRTDPAPGTDDTWAGTISGQLPMLLEVDFHYEIDTVGSRTVSDK